jgi:hypothetical protein
MVEKLITSRLAATAPGSAVRTTAQYPAAPTSAYAANVGFLPTLSIRYALTQ